MKVDLRAADHYQGVKFSTVDELFCAAAWMESVIL